MTLTREFKKIWSKLEKITFKFIFLYFTLYIISIFTAPIWEPIVKWIGSAIFNINYNFSSNGKGSGDTTYAYLLLFLFLCLSIFGSLIWSFIDKKRKSYNQIQYVFLIILRIILIFFMFQYGIIKIFHLQMPPISNADLIQVFGNKSPMGLAWSFMGFSKTYSIFAGLAEVIAGILLVSRRTQTYGAIATVVVMLNVFMMNLCFDIPVKIFSFHLFLMGFVLLIADFKRVFGVLIQNKNIGNYIIYPQLKRDDKQIIIIAKLAMLFILVSFLSFTSYPRYQNKYIKPKAPLYGLWEVNKFRIGDNKEINESNWKKRWRYLAIDKAKFATIKTLGDKQSYLKFIVDTSKSTINFGAYKTKKLITLNYIKKDSTLTIEGIINNDTLKVELYKKKLNNFLLTKRGFNWINENPLNK